MGRDLRIPIKPHMPLTVTFHARQEAPNLLRVFCSADFSQPQPMDNRPIPIFQTACYIITH